MVKSIETKQKTLQRSAEDAQNEFQQQQNEIAQRIMQKMAPVIMKYLADNGYGLLLDNFHAVAAGSGGVWRPGVGHHQADRGRLQRAVWRACTSAERSCDRRG